MSAPMHLIALFALSYAGFGALSVAMQRHYADLHGRGTEAPPPLRRRLQICGVSALALAFAAALQAVGAGHGPVLWLGSLTAAALLLMLLLSYMPRRAAQLAQAAGVVGLLAFLVAGIF